MNRELEELKAWIFSWSRLGTRSYVGSGGRHCVWPTPRPVSSSNLSDKIWNLEISSLLFFICMASERKPGQGRARQSVMLSLTASLMIDTSRWVSGQRCVVLCCVVLCSSLWSPPDPDLPRQTGREGAGRGLDTAANQGEKIHPTHDLIALPTSICGISVCWPKTLALRYTTQFLHSLNLLHYTVVDLVCHLESSY